jgi:excisionase family DNA binding protein
MTTTMERNPIVADAAERRKLKEIEEIFAGAQARLVGSDGTSLEIPDPLYEVLVEAARALRQGKAVSIVPTSHELTTQQAAELLNVSRPHLISLLERGDIPFTKVGTHRRVRFQDILEYRTKRSALRRKVLAELTTDAQDLGIYED